MDSSETVKPKLDDLISQDTIKKGRSIFRAINHGMRRQILELLLETGPMRVTEIYLALRIDQSVCSQQLKYLREAGIVTTKRQGKLIEYTIDTGAVKRLNDLTLSIIDEVLPKPKQKN